ncbi:MAG TPA: hypothetical protein VF585_06870 [Chthoniobacterales bacterium]|jgi:hypothetical protein
MHSTPSSEISVGDVIRQHWPVEAGKSLNLYLGTGRCGGCFDAYGLQHQDPLSPAVRRVSQTVMTHAEVWHRGRHGLDTLVPLACLRWDELPQPPTRAYRQHLEIAAGRLTTEFDNGDFRYKLVAFTSLAAEQRDLLSFHISWSGDNRPALVLSPVPIYRSDYSGELKANCQATSDGSRATSAIQRGNARGLTVAQATGNLRLEVREGKVFLHLDSAAGEGTLLIAMGPEARGEELRAALDATANQSQATANQFQATAEASWADRWSRQKQVSLEPLGWRSLYHIFCSYAPDVRCPAPPNGFTGNTWGYHFPQDLSYIHPALLALGHSDITRAHVEFYHSRLDNQRALTTEIYGKPGVCWSWEFPIGDNARLFRPEDGGAPNEFQFEIHNAAYPARMAAETAAVLNDAAWTRDIAWPMLQESARFLASGLELDANGKFSMHITPSMGQDEFGGANAKNYLCALFATSYTLREAIAMAAQLDVQDEETSRWESILQTGLAYDSLLIPETGFYATNGSTPFLPAKQKHPVQLNPLWLLPTDIDEPTRAAYRQRRTVCSTERENQRHPQVPTGFYDGWTLFAFQLSAARMQDAAGYAHELWEMIPSRLIDPDAITIYESSGYWQPYYTTSMGLYLQGQLLAKSE